MHWGGRGGGRWGGHCGDMGGGGIEGRELARGRCLLRAEGKERGLTLVEAAVAIGGRRRLGCVSEGEAILANWLASRAGQRQGEAEEI